MASPGPVGTAEARTGSPGHIMKWPICFLPLPHQSQSSHVVPPPSLETGAKLPLTPSNAPPLETNPREESVGGRHGGTSSLGGSEVQMKK